MKLKYCEGMDEDIITDTPENLLFIQDEDQSTSKFTFKRIVSKIDSQSYRYLKVEM